MPKQTNIFADWQILSQKDVQQEVVIEKNGSKAVVIPVTRHQSTLALKITAWCYCLNYYGCYFDRLIHRMTFNKTNISMK